MNEIVVASTNEGKIEEIREILEGYEITLLTLKDFPEIGAIREDGSSLQENAKLKAHSCHQLTGITSLADDTGLEVYPLDMEPGIHTARYAGPEADPQKNIEKLLNELKKYKTPEERRARFRSVLVLYDGYEEHIFEGICEGHICFETRGSNGFGYDPVFVPDGHTSTFGEMTPFQKNLISHRSIAIGHFQEFLETSDLF